MKRQLKRLCSCALLCALLLTVLPAPAAAASTGFSDVPASHWAAEEIRRAVDLGLFQGESSGRFGLGKPMTRAAFVVVLCRFFEWEIVKPQTGSYTDNQDPSAWYYGAVETAYAHGAITDQTDTFRPNDAVTREEIAVMLIRALGYSSLAGLSQEQAMPFTDVRTNTGYIAMAYTLGLVSGTSKTAFSPDKAATREQAAVMLMRLYDKCHADAPIRSGILAPGEDEAVLTGCAAAAVAAYKLIYAGEIRLVETAPAEEAAALRAQAEEAGVQPLLYVSGTASSVRGDADTTAALLRQAVDAGDYAGLFLDVTGLTGTDKKDFSALAWALDEAMEGKLLYLTAEAPVQGGRANGYDYAVLGTAADTLVVRVAAGEDSADGFPVAPPEPMEAVYYALTQIKSLVDPGKLSLMLTTTGTSWLQKRLEGTLTAAQIQTLRKSIFTETYYSGRYACSYLTDASASAERVVWYLDQESVAQRLLMAAFFGVGQVCLSDLRSVADYEGYSVLEALS